MNSNPEDSAEIFRQMHDAGWDTSLPLKWGFFFFHKHHNMLVDLRVALEGEGYHFEELHKTKNSLWVLQMSKDEIHTPESLHARNLQFNRLAEERGVDLYDGWDVGKIEA